MSGVIVEAGRVFLRTMKGTIVSNTLNDVPAQGEPASEFAKANDAALSAQSLSDSLLAEGLANGVVGMSLDDKFPTAMRSYLRWTADRGWMRWTGKVWGHIPDPHAVELVRRELKTSFLVASTHEHANAISVKLAAPLLSETKARKVTFFLKGLLTTKPEKFDSHFNLLNVQNGVIDLETGDLLPHDPKLFFTKIAAAEWHPRAKHADWAQALSALPSDVQEYIQVRYGQAATGYPTDDDVLLVQSGGGQNGKSTIVNAIASALGDFSTFVPEKVLLARPGEHPTELMTLRGARCAIIEETPEGHYLPTKRLKDLVGTPVMTARAMRQDFVSWDTSHTLFVNTNFVPQVSETDWGTWRRLQLVRFPYKFVHPSEPLMAPNEKHGDPGLRDRIRFNTDRQLEAVLAWVVEGTLQWFAGGRQQLPTPLTIQDDTQAWRAESDLILAYVQERLTFDAASMIQASNLFEDFSQWLSDNHRTPWNEQTFSTRMASHDLIERNHVAKKRVNTPANVSVRWPGTPPVGRSMMWLGLKFS